MKSTRRVWVLITMLALSVLATDCVAKVVPSSREPIILGAVCSLKGEQAPLDVPSSMGYPDKSRIPIKAVTILEIMRGAYRLIQQLLPAATPGP